ncbi:cupin domain-containing protein [Acidovorax sp. LjRoot129]|uniref:cupin domain-containing protein n=1 Tax=Acidovorax sp. LjRoot129 TaxID=3342260 RepID=UPI003ECF42C3
MYKTALCPVATLQTPPTGTTLQTYPDPTTMSDTVNTPTTTAAHPVDLAQKLTQFADHWAPRTVAEFNGHDIMVAKIQGEYQWHSHPDTDDFFLVLRGSVEIDLPGGAMVTLHPGQLFVVPKGVEHRPRASAEAHILLIESTGTPNSGDAATAAPRRVL